VVAFKFCCGSRCVECVLGLFDGKADEWMRMKFVSVCGNRRDFLPGSDRGGGFSELITVVAVSAIVLILCGERK